MSMAICLLTFFLLLRHACIPRHFIEQWYACELFPVHIHTSSVSSFWLSEYSPLFMPCCGSVLPEQEDKANIRNKNKDILFSIVTIFPNNVFEVLNIISYIFINIIYMNVIFSLVTSFLLYYRHASSHIFRIIQPLFGARTWQVCFVGLPLLFLTQGTCHASSHVLSEGRSMLRRSAELPTRPHHAQLYRHYLHL